MTCTFDLNQKLDLDSSCKKSIKHSTANWSVSVT